MEVFFEYMYMVTIIIFQLHLNSSFNITFMSFAFKLSYFVYT